MNRRKRLALYTGILLLIVAVILMLYQNDSRSASVGFERDNYSTRSEPIVRDVSKLVYTKHARCRMDCRKISEEEVQEILTEGKINHVKSDPRSKPDPKYAFEGVTEDDQHVRIIFADSERGIVVVTVIDLEREWTCNCN